MREFTRIILRVFMLLFLVVGCVQNIYYMADITKDNEYSTYGRRHKKAERPSVTYDENGYNEYQQPNVEQVDTIKVDLTQEEREYEMSRYARYPY